MKFQEYKWGGNGWASIEIEPAGTTEFLRILEHLAHAYGFALPSLVDTIDGYAADFDILGSYATFSLDTWSFSIAFEKPAVRDRVITDLRLLPEDYFS